MCVENICGYLVVVFWVFKYVHGNTTMVDIDEGCMGFFGVNHDILSCPISIIIITVLQNHAARFTYIRINHITMARTCEFRYHRTYSCTFRFKHLFAIPYPTKPNDSHFFLNMLSLWTLLQSPYFQPSTKAPSSSYPHLQNMTRIACNCWTINHITNYCKPQHWFFHAHQSKLTFSSCQCRPQWRKYYLTRIL